MSERHPIIAITGSSGAGTTSVTRTFENIFRREKVAAAVIEGDSFHRYDRLEMKRRQAEAEAAGNRNFSHFGSENNLFAELELLFGSYAESGTGRRRKYLHDAEEAAPYKQEPGTFTPWEDLPADTDLLFYEGLHGAVVTPEVNIARHPDLLIGVVPVINLEWIQKLWRDQKQRGYSTEAVTDTILRRMPDYVNYICPQFTHTHVNFQRVPLRRYQQPVHRTRHPVTRREHGRDPLRQSQGHRLPVPAEHDPRLVHVACQHHRRARRQDGTGDAADLHALHLAHDGTAQARPGSDLDDLLPAMTAWSAPTTASATRWPTPCARWRWTRCSRPTPAIPARRWAWPRWPWRLWSRHLRHNPANPKWPDRDRFVLSNGHASMLLYALLHLSGYDLPIDELKRFRQLHSKTPGHPEVGLTPGVETTTGPLGQGLANAVGFALAEKLLADEFNRPGHGIVDHFTYVFVGDGCLMEGISHEACSLAGVWRLNKLIVLYDDNGISIDGEVDGLVRRRHAGAFSRLRLARHRTDRRPQRRRGRRGDRASRALERQADADRLPHHHRQGLAGARRHGQGARRAARRRRDPRTPARRSIGRMRRSRFRRRSRRAGTRAQSGAERERDWQARFAAYRAAHPQLAGEFERRMAGELPRDFEETLIGAMAEFGASRETMASRKASQKVLAMLAPKVPELLGGSADLTGSNLTDFAGCGAVRGGEQGGRHINYGVREFGMAAVMNGIALHGGFIPYGGTFLTFSDYSRNAIRMAALMKQRVIHVFTHDSIGLGEDGPTHQSVEHAASLRLVPNLDVWRPCDAAETAVAWTQALLQADRPSALLLSRQNLPAQTRSPEQVLAIRRGGYVLSDRSEAQGVILATGSEVALAMAAQALLDERGVAVRVVSIPSSTLFDRQDKAYREAVLGTGLPRIGVEAGVTRWWGQYGCCAALGVDQFGESAPAAQVFAHVGLTAEALAALVHAQCDDEQRLVRSSH